MEMLPPELTALLSNTYVQIAVSALALYLVPTGWLLKIPVFGPVLNEALARFARAQMETRLRIEELVDAKADRIVQNKEQLIRSGVIDTGTAKVQGLRELMGSFSLTQPQADHFLEAAVYRVNAGPRPLSEFDWDGTESFELGSTSTLN